MKTLVLGASLSVVAIIVICIASISVAVWRRNGKRREYESIPGPKSDIENPLMSTQLRTQYNGMFQIKGTEIKMTGPRIGKGRQVTSLCCMLTLSVQLW